MTLEVTNQQLPTSGCSPIASATSSASQSQSISQLAIEILQCQVPQPESPFSLSLRGEPPSPSLLIFRNEPPSPSSLLSANVEPESPLSLTLRGEPPSPLLLSAHVETGCSVQEGCDDEKSTSKLNLSAEIATDVPNTLLQRYLLWHPQPTQATPADVALDIYEDDDSKSERSLAVLRVSEEEPVQKDNVEKVAQELRETKQSLEVLRKGFIDVHTLHGKCVALQTRIDELTFRMHTLTAENDNLKKEHDHLHSHWKKDFIATALNMAGLGLAAFSSAYVAATTDVASFIDTTPAVAGTAGLVLAVGTGLLSCYNNATNYFATRAKQQELEFKGQALQRLEGNINDLEEDLKTLQGQHRRKSVQLGL